MKSPALSAAFGLVLALIGLPALAADYPARTEGDYVVRDFRFHTGEVLPELRLHYTTLGDPSHEAVLVLHGTGGSGSSQLSPAFAGELFGPGQPLDANRYFIILPNGVGLGRSSRPSDGLRSAFPQYNYDDMVAAQYRLLTEKLGVRHLRLVIGNSMGGMHVWLWGERYPGFMDTLVPMASTPAAMSGRNWMLRRLLIETIKADPEYRGGAYTRQPPSMKLAGTFYAIATAGGTLAYQAAAPDRASADLLVDERLAGPNSGDANDTVYQWSASRDYDPTPTLSRIEAPVLAINSADDERNPPETGAMEAGLKQVKRGELYLIPASAQTRGHGTTGNAKFYAARLKAFLDWAPKRN